MVTKMNLWSLEDCGEIFPIMSMPYTENGHGEVSACNFKGGTWIRSLWIWHSEHLWINWQQSVSIVNQKYSVLIMLQANMCHPICCPQTLAWTSLITRSVEAQSKHKITSHQLIVCIVSLHKSQIGCPTVSMLSYPWPWRPQDIMPSLKKWYMSWYHGKPSSNYAPSIRK